MESLNLEEYLIVTNDLPPGFEASQILYQPSPFTENAPNPEYYIRQVISTNEKPIGYIEVSVYTNGQDFVDALNHFLTLGFMNNNIATELVGHKFNLIPTFRSG